MFRKIQEFINLHKNKQILGVIIVILILAALPLTVIISQQRQEIRQRASEPESPISTNEISCPYEISENICIRKHDLVSNEVLDIRLKTDKTIVSVGDSVELEFNVKNKGKDTVKIFYNRPAIEGQSSEGLIFFDTTSDYNKISGNESVPKEINGGEEKTFRVRNEITQEAINAFVGNGYMMYQITANYNNKYIGSFQFPIFIRKESLNACGLSISAEGKCTKDGIFFAGAECISHQECVPGACINGYCLRKIGGIAEESGQGVSLNNVDFWRVTSYYHDAAALLKGKFKILVLVDSAINTPEVKDALSKTLKFTSDWYDTQSVSYLNEDVIDLFFDVEFINSGDIEKCVDGSDSDACILESISKIKNINEYDKFVLFFSNDLTNKLCGGIVAGCTGVRTVRINTESMLEPEINADTLVHELLHHFGQQKHTGDYKGLLTRSVKNVGFMSKEFELDSLYATEIGWGDIDRDGRVDIKQIKISNDLPKDIKMSKASYKVVELPDNRITIDLYFELKDEKDNFLIPTKENPIIIEAESSELANSPSFTVYATNNVIIQKEIDSNKKSVPYKFSVEYRGIKKTVEGTCQLKLSDTKGACTPTLTPGQCSELSWNEVDWNNYNEIDWLTYRDAPGFWTTDASPPQRPSRANTKGDKWLEANPRQTIPPEHPITCTVPTPTPTPSPSLALVLNPIGSKSVTAGQTLTFTVSASAPNNAPLIWKLGALPDLNGDSYIDINDRTHIFRLTTKPISEYTQEDLKADLDRDETIDISDTVLADLSFPGGASNTNVRLFHIPTRTFSWTPIVGWEGLTHKVKFGVSDGISRASETITITVSKSTQPSPTPIVDACTVCSADINKDGTVNIQDTAVINSCLNKAISDTCVNADIDKNGKIDIVDLNCAFKNFLKICQ